ncbi:stalk domain-containing protein [Wukongibacter baidiensis]|uniref:stalk domain-containing protein n=1 Tax=Wukongibacter baidiensis TaxID=1723361 RepID=UPI003D7FE036
MKKKLLLLISFFIFFSFANINAYADPTDESPKPITVELNGEVLEFDTEPIIVNNRTMVPMRAIFEQLGAKINWHNETKTVTAYRRYKGISDMFVKLTIGEEFAYRNGKSWPLDSPAIIRDSRTLVPVRFVAESFGGKVDWDPENRIVLLTYDVDEFQGTKLIGDMSYKPVYFANDLEIMIPEFWLETEKSSKFAYKDEENNIQMSVDIIPLEEDKTLDKFTEESKTSILDAYKDKVVFTGSDKININSIDVSVVYLKNSSVTPEIDQVIYYFTSSGYGYKITFSYYSESNDSQLLNTISDIINTIEISGVTFNLDKEHYIEYDAFFNYGINLSSEIYSNMEVDKPFAFTGTVGDDIDLEHVVVSIAREGKVSEYKIPISNKEFNATIYTPFGLGRHNMTVKTPESEDNPSRKLMQFSIINNNNQDITYLVPSMLVEKDDPDIVALAQEITKDIDKEYLAENEKAEAIYKWIFENIEYDTEAADALSRSAKGVLVDKKGTNEEISYLFAALLRASNIQSKLIQGSILEETHVWNEMLVNGKWLIVDVTWGSGYIDTENITKELDMSYFKANRTTYESKFDKDSIITLEY